MDLTTLSSQYMIANTILTTIKMIPILLCIFEPTFNDVLSFHLLLLLRINVRKANKTSYEKISVGFHNLSVFSEE